MKKPGKLIVRFLVLPFMICIIAISIIILFIKSVRGFILYGGETILYEEKNEGKAIKDLYFLMKENIKSK